MLVLDLDGTLLDTARPFVRQGAYTFLIAFDDVDVREVRLRPGLAAFLEAVMPHFELAIFTAATAAYAEEMAKGIDALVPGFRSALKAIFSKEHAHITPDGYVTKTLSLLADHVGKPLCRTLIVDDNPTTYRLNVSNALPIPVYAGEASDAALATLQSFMLSLPKSGAPLDVSTYALADPGAGPLLAEVVDGRTLGGRRLDCFPSERKPSSPELW